MVLKFLFVIVLFSFYLFPSLFCLNLMDEKWYWNYFFFFFFISHQKKKKKNHSNVEPVPTILGGPDLFVDKGSTINLTCTIRFGPEPPGHIFWYHENKVSNTIANIEQKKNHKQIEIFKKK